MTLIILKFYSYSVSVLCIKTAYRAHHTTHTTNKAGLTCETQRYTALCPTAALSLVCCASVFSQLTS